MSESHDIEQIVRESLEAIAEDPFWHFEDAAKAIAQSILPLIASAREEGAREMRERAAVAAETRYAGAGWHPAAINAGIGIASSIREIGP